MKKATCFPVALAYLDRGWASLALCPPHHQGVSPYHASTCTSPGKRPLGQWKSWQSRLPTLEEVVAQWEQVPRSNVGVIMGQVSGLVEIDVDGDEGQRLLQEASGDEGLPGTLAFWTPRGMRLLYALEPGMTPRSWSVHQGESEVKVLGEGSLTVMPPSRHQSGKVYRWLPRRGPAHMGLAIAPGWLLRPPARMARRSGGQRARPRDDGHQAGSGPIPQGRRNETLFRIACAMRGRGATEGEILAAIMVVNQRCRPPLEPRELRSIAGSVSRYPPPSESQRGHRRS
jgi:hypothetical protein